MLSLFFLSLVFVAALGASPVVDTSYGPVEGFEFGLGNGDVANIFLGIPFAKPPVGDLRFEKPRKLDKWTEVKQAKEFGLSCQPHHESMMFGHPETFGEDCLTLNIMAPATKSADPSGYPVMVFIYGGGFELGDTATYGYKDISNNFVAEGIVFVTLNYRLGAFGFFSTGDHHMPGNIGLWDQTAALHFIQEEISAFGGNPQKVTLSGESAGAVSVSALTLSPHSNKLFQQAIAMSGSMFHPCVSDDRLVDVSKELAAAIGCVGESEEIVVCMKEKSAADIMKGVEIIGPSHDHFCPYKFYPRMGGDFFPSSVETMLQEAPKIPFMTGVNEKEGGMMSVGYTVPALAEYFGIPAEKWQSYSAKELKEFISEKTLKKGDPKELKDKLIEFYVERPMEGKDQMDWQDYLERFTLLGSDLHYVFPMYHEAMSKIVVGIPVYLFVEEYNNQENQAHLPVKGAYHTNELIYIFGTNFLGPFEPTDADRAFQKNLLEGFTSFIKTGKPTVQNKTWTQATKEHPDRIMSFAPESQMKEKFMVDSINFWKDNMAKKEVSHSEL